MKIVFFSDLHYAPERPINNGSMTENINDDGVPDGVYYIVEFDGKSIEIVEKHVRL